MSGSGNSPAIRCSISLALMPLAIATNFLGFWLVQRIPTGLFYRITYALMFLISARAPRAGRGRTVADLDLMRGQLIAARSRG